MSKLSIVRESTHMTHQERIQESLNKASVKDFQGNKWGQRHAKVWARGREMGFSVMERGTPIVMMIEAWARYADQHAGRYESGIGDDGFLGPEWEQIGKSILALLNGECGDLDCGTVDALIRDMLKAEGFEEG